MVAGLAGMLATRRIAGDEGSGMGSLAVTVVTDILVAGALIGLSAALGAGSGLLFAIAFAPEMGLLGVTAAEALGKRWPPARIITAAGGHWRGHHRRRRPRLAGHLGTAGPGHHSPGPGRQRHHLPDPAGTAARGPRDRRGTGRGGHLVRLHPAVLPRRDRRRVRHGADEPSAPCFRAGTAAVTGRAFGH